jgi:hypothetical protein
MLVEICNYCNKMLGILIFNGKPCCQFCEEEQKKKSKNTKENEK